VIRRLAPHCSRVEMADLPYRKDELKLLKAMGRETANIHFGSKDALDGVKSDLLARKAEWLTKAATAMVEATRKDWTDWRG